MPLASKLPLRAIRAVHTDGAPIRLRDAPQSAWLVLFAIMVFYVGGIGVWAFLERVAVHAGIERAAASNAIAVGLFVGVVGSLGAAVFAGRTKRIWPETLAGLMLVASFAMLTFVGGTAQFYFAVFVFNCSWNFFIPFVIGLVAGRDSTGRLSSLVPGTVMIGGVLGPVSGRRDDSRIRIPHRDDRDDTDRCDVDRRLHSDREQTVAPARYSGGRRRMRSRRKCKLWPAADAPRRGTPINR